MISPWWGLLYIFIWFLASLQVGKVFRGVYAGDLLSLIRHVLWWIQRLLEKREEGEGKGGQGGEAVNPLVFMYSSLFSIFSLPLSPPLSHLLPPLFLETSHSCESGPSCSQKICLASVLLLSAHVAAVYDTKELEERREGGRYEDSSSLSCSPERGSEKWILCDPFTYFLLLLFF